MEEGKKSIWFIFEIRWVWMNERLVASGQTGHIKYLPFKCEQVRNIALSPLCGLYILLLFHTIIKLNGLPLWYILNWENIITSLLKYTCGITFTDGWN